MYTGRSKKQKFKDMARILEKHHKGELPKSAYAPDGHIYPKAIFSKDSQKACMARAKAKDKQDEAKMAAEAKAMKERVRNRQVKIDGELLKTKDLKRIMREK